MVTLTLLTMYPSMSAGFETTLEAIRRCDLEALEKAGTATDMANAVRELRTSHATGGGYSSQWVSPLNEAIERRCHQAVAWLLDRGAKPDVRQHDRHEAPLVVAARAGDVEITRLLIHRGADVNVSTKRQQKNRYAFDTPLMVAAREGHLAVVEVLLQYNADVNSRNYHFDPTALLRAAERGHNEIVMRLARDGADVNARTSGINSRTAMHFAIDRNNLELARLLLRSGFALDRTDGTWPSGPLTLAISTKRYEIAALLLEHGANPNELDRWGNPALAVAIGNRGAEDLIVARLLVSKGANVLAQDRSGKSILVVAVENGNAELITAIVARARSAGAKAGDFAQPLFSAVRARKLDLVHELQRAGADLKSTLPDGMTLLHAGAEAGDVEIVAYLLKQGIDVNVTDRLASTPLHRAVSARNAEDITRLLLQFGARPDARDHNLFTALHRPVEPGVAFLLLQAGADASAKTAYGRDALSYQTNAETIRVFQSAGAGK